MPATQSLREFLECLPISLMRQLLSGLELLSPRRRLGRRDDQALAVGTDIQRRPRLNFQKVEDGAINYQRQAVSVLRQLLQHAHSVSPMYHQWGYGTKALLSVVISGCAAARARRRLTPVKCPAISSLEASTRGCGNGHRRTDGPPHREPEFPARKPSGRSEEHT